MDIRSIIDTNDAPPPRKPTLPSASGQPSRSPSEPISNINHGHGMNHGPQRESKTRQLSSVQTSPYQESRYLQSPYATISPNQASSPPGRTPSGSLDGQKSVYHVTSQPFGSITPDGHASPPPARRTSSMGIGSMLNAAPPSPKDSNVGVIKTATIRSDSSATHLERKPTSSSSRGARTHNSPSTSSQAIQHPPTDDAVAPLHHASSMLNSSISTMSPSKAQKRSGESTIDLELPRYLRCPQSHHEIVALYSYHIRSRQTCLRSTADGSFHYSARLTLSSSSR